MHFVYHYDTLIEMNDTLSDRQLRIMRYLQKVNKASRSELEKVLNDISKVTIIRDLKLLIGRGLVATSGRSVATVYTITAKAKQLKLYEPAAYLRLDQDDRDVQFTSYSPERLSRFKDCLSGREVRQVHSLIKAYKARVVDGVASRELERFIIEFSWKSAQIEGNTYSLLDTERLLKEAIRAPGHSYKEAVMLLNHKTAFEYVWQNKEIFQDLSRKDIDDVHQLLVRKLNIKTGLRQLPVGIIGTNYVPPASQIEIASHLDQFLKLVNSQSEPLIKALITLVGISYLQPFNDGNKRTARLMSNAILAAYGYPPLSYRPVDQQVFKGALILFYEQAALDYMKEIFIQQLEFSAKNYNF